MASVILIALGAAATWAAGAYLFPFRHCRKCGGTGRKIRKLNRAHFALCNRCAGTGRVLFLHILPNTLAPICVVASFSMAQAILTEAALSFLGVGLDPSTPSWGTMLNDGRDYLLTAWWIATMPGIFLYHPSRRQTPMPLQVFLKFVEKWRKHAWVTRRAS